MGNADPPIFTLAFNVTSSPPTSVHCTVNGASTDLKHLSRSIADGINNVTSVTVTLNTRDAGIYECTVSNARVNNIDAFNSSVQINMTGRAAQPQLSTTIIPLSIAVAGTPSNFRATNFQYTSANLSWAPVLDAAGYEVFYYENGGQGLLMSAGNTTDTTLVVGPFNLMTHYSFFVVAFQDGIYTLPSAASNEDSIEFSKLAKYFGAS